MKQKSLRSFLRKRAIIIFLLALTSFSLLLSSFTTYKMGDDMWKILGISKQTGNDKIKSSFINGYLDHYRIKNIRNIAANNREALARDLLVYTKQFVNGPVFTKEYNYMRKNAKPQEPVLKPLRTIEEIQKAEIAKTEKSIKDTEKNMKDMPQYSKTMEPMLQILKEYLKKFQDPKNSYFSAVAMGEKYDQENELRRFKENTKRWEEEYPVAVNQFIATRLTMMLDATKDIDYNAEVVLKGGKKKFVNPVYESKNQEWKQGFRAGKEVTERARAFAKEWLIELQEKK